MSLFVVCKQKREFSIAAWSAHVSGTAVRNICVDQKAPWSAHVAMFLGHSLFVVRLG